MATTRATPPGSTGPPWSIILPALAAAAAAAGCLAFRPDDLYIYLRVVSNVLAGLGAGFNPHDPVNVASSPLWLLALLVLGAIGLRGALWAQLLSAACWLAAITGAAWLARRLAGDRRAAWCAGLALAGDAWVGRWLWSGMETGLAVAVVVGSAALRFGTRRGGTGDRAASVLLALAPLVRPELLAWTLAVLAVEAIGLRRHGRSRLLRDASLLALAGAGWCSVSLAVWGSVLPSTIVAKSTLGAANIGVLPAAGRVLLVIFSTQAALLLALPAAAWAFGREREGQVERAPGRADLARAVALFTLLMIAGYGLRHVKVYTRYVLPLTALVVIVSAAWLVGLARGGTGGRHRRWAWVAALGLTLVGNLALSTVVVVPRTRAYARSMNRVVIPLARRLARETASDAVIAVPNIGAIGLLSGRRILDLNGLATPQILPAKREGKVAQFLTQHPPDLLIGIDPAPRAWDGRLAPLRLEEQEIHRFEGMFVRGPDPMYLTVYRVVHPAEPPR